MTAPHPDRRPLDTYDPTPDGHIPLNLGGTIYVLQNLVDAIEDARAALAGCTTPLNLTLMDDELRKMAWPATESLDHLRRAAAHIEADSPLAGAFEGEKPWWEDRRSVLLSPRQILALAARAEAVSPDQQVTYREVLAAAGNPEPSIIQRDRKNAEAAERRANREQLHDLILEDIEKQPCPMCGAAPGAYCRTSSGRVGGPHAGRRNASPMAREYPGVAKTVKRDDVEAEQRFRDERAARIDEERRISEDRALVGEVVGELAEKWALREGF